jgi:hypothetical protein
MRAAKLKRTKKDMADRLSLGRCCFAMGVLRYLNIEWVRFAAHAARTCDI